MFSFTYLPFFNFHSFSWLKHFILGHFPSSWSINFIIFFAKYLIWSWWMFSFSTLMMLFHCILPVAVSKLAVILNTLPFKQSVFFCLAILWSSLFVCVLYCHCGMDFFLFILFVIQWPSWICIGAFQLLSKFLSLLLKLFLLYSLLFPFMQLQWNISWTVTWSVSFKHCFL